MRLIGAALAACGLALVSLPAVAAADSPANPNCLGVVTAQRAVAHHDIGAHASAQEEPRLGLGNITREILGEDAHIGDFGAFLGEIDGDDATSCP
jgi:hypothetical protein